MWGCYGPIIPTPGGYRTETSSTAGNMHIGDLAREIELQILQFCLPGGMSALSRVNTSLQVCSLQSHPLLRLAIRLSRGRHVEVLAADRVTLATAYIDYQSVIMILDLYLLSILNCITHIPLRLSLIMICGLPSTSRTTTTLRLVKQPLFSIHCCTTISVGYEEG